MSIPKFVAVLGWISVFALMWLMAIPHSAINEDRWMALATLTMFFIIAAVSSSLEGKKDDRTNKEG